MIWPLGLLNYIGIGYDHGWGHVELKTKIRNNRYDDNQKYFFHNCAFYRDCFDLDRNMTELLAPAGSLEKLKIAVSYGADAIYLAGQSFGLRTAAGNFSADELSLGVEFAKNNGVKTYVAVNSVMHDADIATLTPFIQSLDRLKVDGIIVSDLGALKVIKDNCNIPLHLSTQASCLNSMAAKLWKEMGIKRIVLGRECSLADAIKIKEEAQIEVEIFVHGAMCISYSGNCLISNYCAGRDSNRGGCAQNCRFLYSNDDREDDQGYFLSSKDLCAIDFIPEIIAAGIDSVKIEGRMKSHLYVGTTTKAYRNAMDSFETIPNGKEELMKFSHRDYFEGNLRSKASADSIFRSRESSRKEYAAVGIVIEVVKNSHLVVEIRSAFNIGDQLEFIPFCGSTHYVLASEVTDMMGNPYKRTKPGILVKMPFIPGIEKWNLVRKKIET